MGVCRWAKPDIQHMDVESARKMYRLARKFRFEKGYTRHQPMRKITTSAQYAEWVKKSFDFYNNDNDAEAELAMQEMFVGQGYLEVPV